MIKQIQNGVLIKVRVKTNSKSFGFVDKKDQLILEVKSPPKEGKANTEIVKELRKMFGKDVEIVKGLKGKDKIILVKNAKIEEIKY
ncbi:MAG: YggU family protein [Candidatus Aenigmarchaeota archaeon]|nr:YggU family protein [Candidatus Aenigmarchaeota archaeon]